MSLEPGIFQHHYRDKATGERRLCQTLYIRYTVNGKRVEESTGLRGATQKNVREARKLRALKMDRADRGEAVGPRVKRTTFEDLKLAVLQHYELQDLRSIATARTRLKALECEFGGTKARAITTSWLKSYSMRRKRKVSNATINRELAILRQAFRIAWDDGLVAHIPKFPRLEEPPPREGILYPAEFATLCETMARTHPEHTGWLRVAYWSGWRWQSTVLQLRWEHLGASGWLIAPGLITKNKRAVRRRVFRTDQNGRVWVGPLGGAIGDQRAYVDAIERATGTIIPWMFVYPNGERIKDPTDAFQRAKMEAGFPNLLLHDFCRAAWQNGINAGVPEKDLMEAFGRKTRSIADRYNLTTDERLAAVDEKLAAVCAPAAPPASRALSRKGEVRVKSG